MGGVSNSHLAVRPRAFTKSQYARFANSPPNSLAAAATFTLHSWCLVTNTGVSWTLTPALSRLRANSSRTVGSEGGQGKEERRGGGGGGGGEASGREREVVGRGEKKIRC